MASPIPVLLLVRELGIGGCERDLTKIVRNIDRTVYEPHVCTFFAGGIRRKEVDEAGVPVLDLPLRSFASTDVLKLGKVLGQYMDRHRIQLIHSFDLPTELMSITVGWMHRVPVLIKVELWFRELVHPRYRPIQPLTDGLADAVIVNSRAVGNDLVETHGLPRRKIHLCYNGVETAAFHPEPRTSAGDDIVIGTVCALRAEKRIDVLLRAFAKVREARPGARLVVVGSGPLEKQIQQVRSELGLAAHSHFEPTTSDVARWMHQMDVFVLCSESESFPNALLEAMACGCSVVGSRVGGVPELIQENECGLIFDSGNDGQLAQHLIRLIDDPALRTRFAEKAAARARDQFPIQATIRRTQQIYSQLLNQKSAQLRRNGFEPPELVTGG